MRQLESLGRIESASRHQGRSGPHQGVRCPGEVHRRHGFRRPSREVQDLAGGRLRIAVESTGDQHPVGIELHRSVVGPRRDQLRAGAPCLRLGIVDLGAGQDLVSIKSADGDGVHPAPRDGSEVLSGGGHRLGRLPVIGGIAVGGQDAEFGGGQRLIPIRSAHGQHPALVEIIDRVQHRQLMGLPVFDHARTTVHVVGLQDARLGEDKQRKPHREGHQGESNAGIHGQKLGPVVHLKQSHPRLTHGHVTLFSRHEPHSQHH